MTWKEKYDLFNMSYDGDLFLFGGHYNTEQMRELMKKENYDEPLDYKVKEHSWARFSFLTNYDGERASGWSIIEDKPNSLKGCIEVTELEKEKQREDSE